MRVTLEGAVTEMQPTSIDWLPRELLGKDGTGIPIYGPYYGCNLGFSRITRPVYLRWKRAMDDGSYISSIWLPHPYTGLMTEFTNVTVDSINIRMDGRGSIGYANGVDIRIGRISVT